MICEHFLSVWFSYPYSLPKLLKGLTTSKQFWSHFPWLLNFTEDSWKCDFFLLATIPHSSLLISKVVNKGDTVTKKKNGINLTLRLVLTMFTKQGYFYMYLLNCSEENFYNILMHFKREPWLGLNRVKSCIWLQQWFTSFRCDKVRMKKAASSIIKGAYKV